MVEMRVLFVLTFLGSNPISLFLRGILFRMCFLAHQLRSQSVEARCVSDVLSSPNISAITAEKKPLFCVIPFLKFRTNSLIKKSLREFIKDNYRHLKLKLIFDHSFKVCSFFKFEDSAPTSLVSNAVYLFKCGRGFASYIGVNSRHLNTRACEQKGISSRTAKRLLTPI